MGDTTRTTRSDGPDGPANTPARVAGWLALAVAGVAYRLSGPYTFSAWWALLAFMVVNIYVFCPVVWMSLTSLRNDRRSCAAVPAQIHLPD